MKTLKSYIWSTVGVVGLLGCSAAPDESAVGPSQSDASRAGAAHAGPDRSQSGVGGAAAASSSPARANEDSAVGGNGATEDAIAGLSGNSGVTYDPPAATGGAGQAQDSAKGGNGDPDSTSIGVGGSGETFDPPGGIGGSNATSLDPQGTGGVTAMGGAAATGGAGETRDPPVGGNSAVGGGTAAGGSGDTKDPPHTGGVSASGGAAAIGGDASIGGASSTGGTTTVGTTTVGGSSSTGGNTATGGTTTVGGSSSAGGTTTIGGSSSAGGTTTVGGNTATGGAGSGPGCVMSEIERVNVVVLKDAAPSGADVEGRMWVGGNAVFQAWGYSANATTIPELKTTCAEYGVVVGGNLSGTVILGGGKAAYGGTRTGNFYSNASPQCGIFHETPVNFVALEASLKSYSATFRDYPTNGKVTLTYGSLQLTGVDPKLNVFAVTAAQLQAATEVRLLAPEGSSVVVNVSGSKIVWQNAGFILPDGGRSCRNGDSTWCHRILYNLHEAETLTLNGIGVQGSVLAPYASVDGGNGNIDGQLVAESLFGRIEYHPYFFTGCLQLPKP